MKLLHVTVLLTIVFSQTAFTRCQRRMGNRNAVMAALQNILGPQSYETMPMMGMPNRRMYEEIVPAMPNRAMIPREIAVPNLRVIEPKMPCQMEFAYPTMQEYMPKPVAGVPIVPNMPAAVTGLPIVPNMPAPIVYPPVQPEILTMSIPYPVAAVQEKLACPCGCASPAPLVSPFLPSASPVSPWAPPTSNLLPPVIPSQTRSHFLRKIPIPPPTL